MRVIAIDQGTTSTRALVVDTKTSEARVAHTVKHAQSYLPQGWVEQDANELLANVRACITACGPADAIGLANQGESCLAWDAVSGEPLSPVIVWQDNRTADDVALLAARSDAADMAIRSGLPFDAYFSASKFAWLLAHNADVRDAYRAGRLRFGTTDAFFLDRLTGVFATDASTASRTSLMNLATRQWDPALCSFFGVPLECLPEIRDTAGMFGSVDGVPVSASVVDQQASLYGHGCRVRGDAKITFGTGAFALAITGSDIVRAADKGLVPTVAWAKAGAVIYAVDGGVYDAGAAVDWGMRIGLINDVADLDTFDAPAAIDRDLVFVPALSGLACPHWDRSAGALWLGMSGATTRSDLQQAMIEGIALRTAEVVAAINMLEPIGDTIAVDGGLSQSSYFMQFLADVLGRTVARSNFAERTAFGAAGLAASAFGETIVIEDKITEYAPSADRQAAELRARRFSEAVQRSGGWRG
ncbi:carbohydrate kinase [Terrihabitans soli]|uniref:Carbohydrate kinase n=1 Tax=Terrihabitans soli TaxID=708113 RepID=A0A6S6QTX3_9HYPH|nr:FGGY family carbohydrate kinase [Terrihabitans soli]BCJ90400.1 carbohydrate kinase [Terrihabitans soli]